MAQFIKIKNNIIATDEISNVEQTGCRVKINFKQDSSYIYFDSEEKNEEEAVALLNSIAYALEAVWA